MTATTARPLVRPDGLAGDICPKIPLDALDWREIGATTGDHPRSRLIAKMQIGSVEIHVEAYEVRKNRSTNELTAVAPALRSPLDQLGEIHDSIF